MAEVTLHVYDVTNSGNVRANSAISNLNKIMRGGIGLGGIFHGAVEVYGKEWSFGFCEHGSGVFQCPPKANPMYTYRESLSLGRTELTEIGVQRAVSELMRQWPGASYDLLSRNCNHFCDELCLKLGVQKLPLWVNRFANAGDAAIVAAETTMKRDSLLELIEKVAGFGGGSVEVLGMTRRLPLQNSLGQAKSKVISASETAMRFMFGSGTPTSAASMESSSTGSPSNSGRRFSLMGSPSRLLSRSSPSSSIKGSSGRHGGQATDTPGPSVIYLPWKERALESLDSLSQSPQRPLQAPSH